MNGRRAAPLALLVMAAALTAQTEGGVAASPAVAEAVLTEANVREVVSFLASDELMGRDCPSPGLAAAADYVQRQFEAAGLEPGAGGSWRHHFALPGQAVDARDLQLELAGTPAAGGDAVKLLLQGDGEVRLLAAGATPEGSDPRAEVLQGSDPRLSRALGRGGARRATVLEVAEDHPLWRASVAVREVLTRRLRGSSPVFLVRRGLLPDTGPVPTDVRTAASWTWTVGWRGAVTRAVDVDLTNVVGVLRGAELPDEYVLVSAHYDHIGVGAPVDDDAIYNGADDDASGTTAVVLLARSLAKGPRPRRSVAFVAFAAEEKGLRGSRAFAEDAPLPLAAIVANVNIEMIGRPAPGRQRAAWITGAEYSDFAAIAGPALARGGIELVEFPEASMLFAQSDNLPFAHKGVVAHSISAGSLHADYHKPSDEVALLDLPHMTAVIGGIEQLVRELADRDGRPAYNDAGRAYLSDPRRR